MSFSDTQVCAYALPEKLYDQVVETYDPVSHWSSFSQFMYTYQEQCPNTPFGPAHHLYKTCDDSGDIHLIHLSDIMSYMTSHQKRDLLDIHDLLFRHHLSTHAPITRVLFHDNIHTYKVTYALSDVGYHMTCTRDNSSLYLTTYGRRKYVRVTSIEDIFTDLFSWFSNMSGESIDLETSLPYYKGVRALKQTSLVSFR